MAHKRSPHDDALKLAWLQQFWRGRLLAEISRGEVYLRVMQMWRSATQAGLRFEVCDTGIGIGIGIASDQREAIFGRFEQLGAAALRWYWSGNCAEN